MIKWTMNEDTEDKILCMQHCTNQMNIFFSEFPETCPLCGKSLKGCSLIIPPFRVPSPFMSQNDISCSFVVKPTKGSFLREYKSGDNLHVGITSSNRMVYNFDELGLHADRTGWEQCIVISITEIKEFTSELWDSRLKQMCCSGLWTSEKYDEDNNNCYDFALGFLNQFLPTNIEPFKKLEFCKNYILPWTRRAAQFIDLYRRVQDGGRVAVERCRR